MSLSESSSFLFQSTLLQEERPHLLTVLDHLLEFQSTLLQEERPVAFEFWVRAFYISIHAPTRGATLHLQNPFISDSISIHAPTRGATMKQKHLLRYIYNFNPRSYKRSDHETETLAPLHLQFQSTLLQEERQFKR